MVLVMRRTRWTMGLGETTRMLGLRRDATRRTPSVAASKNVTPERSISMVALPKLANHYPIGGVRHVTVASNCGPAVHESNFRSF